MEPVSITVGHPLFNFIYYLLILLVYKFYYIDISNLKQMNYFSHDSFKWSVMHRQFKNSISLFIAHIYSEKYSEMKDACQYFMYETYSLSTILKKTNTTRILIKSEFLDKSSDANICFTSFKITLCLKMTTFLCEARRSYLAR